MSVQATERPPVQDRRRRVAPARGRPASGRIRVIPRGGQGPTPLSRDTIGPSADMRAYRDAVRRWERGDKGAFKVSPYVDAARARTANGGTGALAKTAFAKAHPLMERAIKWGTTSSTRGGPLGTLYQWGGNGPRYDCSGLMVSIFRKAGIRLPRVSRDQFRVGRAVGKKSLQRGDLLFWSGTWRPGISHVALYLGNGLMLEAPSSGKRVRIVPARINASNYAGARRVI